MHHEVLFVESILEILIELNVNLLLNNCKFVVEIFNVRTLTIQIRKQWII